MLRLILLLVCRGN